MVAGRLLERAGARVRVHGWSRGAT